ncbi:IPT/TIG domain-containing protein [Actinoplanes sp. NPDC049265]|uniref:IPT/TIG domain-containing protein n=1 Tax=Actinoplanes sp. NPDC049265 TaxID=3363902 RepID=UPI00371799F6
MRKSETGTGARLLKAGIATAAAAAVVAGAATPAFAATVPMTLSAITGPSGGLNTLLGKTATAVFTTVPAVNFVVGATCPATFTAPAAVTATAGTVRATAGTVKKLSTTQISITVPAGVALPASTSSLKWNVCAYSGTTVASAAGVTPVVVGSPLVANATYTIAAKPVLAASNVVTPATGPALGGTSVTVTGDGTYKFPTTGVTATIGGEPLTAIVVSSDQLSFTATTPAHGAATNQTLAVTTSGGTVTKAGAFAFTNNLNVTPNTSPGNQSVDVLVEGSGVGDAFATWSAPASSDTDDPHIYLVQGAYNPTANSTNKTLGPIADASGITYIGPNQVLATFNLANSVAVDGTAAAGTPVPDGAYTVTWVTNGKIAVQPGGANVDPLKPYSKSIVTSGSTFTVADY